MDPASVRLLWVSGMRTETPTPTPMLNRLSATPTIRTNRKPPHPQPPRLDLRLLARPPSPSGGMALTRLRQEAVAVERHDLVEGCKRRVTRLVHEVEGQHRVRG